MSLVFDLKSLLKIFLISFLLSCHPVSHEPNPLEGKIFRDISEIKGLHHYKDVASSVIDFNLDKNGDYQFAIGQYTDSINTICILEKLLRPVENGKVNYLILDTINVGKIKKTDYLTFCKCRIDTVWDKEIIALVKAENEKEFYNIVLKAWRADTESGKIIRIKNTKGINCAKEDDDYDE